MFTSTWWRVKTPASLGLREHRDEVVGRRLGALVHLRRDVLDHPLDALHQVPHPVGLAAVDVEELVRQVAQVVAVLLGHAHHLRDHAHGQRRGKRLEDVHPPLRLDLVEELGAPRGGRTAATPPSPAG